ncbi:MAG: hypothetical protein GF315_07890 [candidate division Zixibacteria bacterium]|nr:hypothetical protein [candidate division Zixibacteria bacterium]
MKSLLSKLIVFVIIALAMLLTQISCSDDSTNPKPQPCYDLTVTVIGLGAVESDPDSNCYHQGTEVELTAVPDNGWLFDMWAGNVAFEDSAEFDSAIVITFGSEDIELTASFAEDSAYTDSVTLSGSITRQDGISLQYPVFLLINADFDSILASWDFSGGVDSVQFEVKFSVDDIDSSYIHAIDNIDNDEWLFEENEPWDCYDPDGDTNCNVVTYDTGMTIEDINLTLDFFGRKQREIRPPVIKLNK